VPRIRSSGWPRELAGERPGRQEVNSRRTGSAYFAEAFTSVSK
jgi:hypothetical protein